MCGCLWEICKRAIISPLFLSLSLGLLSVVIQSFRFRGEGRDLCLNGHLAGVCCELVQLLERPHKYVHTLAEPVCGVEFLLLDELGVLI